MIRRVFRSKLRDIQESEESIRKTKGRRHVDGVSKTRTYQVCRSQGVDSWRVQHFQSCWKHQAESFRTPNQVQSTTPEHGTSRTCRSWSSVRLSKRNSKLDSNKMVELTLANPHLPVISNWCHCWNCQNAPGGFRMSCPSTASVLPLKPPPLPCYSCTWRCEGPWPSSGGSLDPLDAIGWRGRKDGWKTKTN